MKIGNVTLKNRYILAPMAGVTDLPFRLLCSRNGAGMVCMEMISAKAVTYDNKKTFDLMKISEDEHPVSLQIFGSDPEIMAEAARRIEEQPFDILDINMGCPMPKIVNNGEGCTLMKDPVLAGRIVESVSKAVKKPVTVKIRKGFDDESVNAVEIAKICEDSGAAAITVHGRTREQYYEGKADRDIIRSVKEAVKIPVIGNGDVKDMETCRAMFEETGCDAVAVGRAAKGNPWIFRSLTEGKEYRPSVEEIKNVMREHCRMQKELKGEYIGVREMRKHISWYTTGMPGSAKLRSRINSAETLEELLALIEGLS
ncbi:MAG: tRNA dihydrouridine synthase DusB [Lachnospiraceae bacterium]|nr:tRNA dihydrouridine synthase DusB [Lachnospiraceae bacterium]